MKTSDSPASKTTKSMVTRVIMRFVSLIMYAFGLRACCEFGSLVSARLLSLPTAVGWWWRWWLLLLMDMYSLNAGVCLWPNATGAAVLLLVLTVVAAVVPSWFPPKYNWRSSSKSSMCSICSVVVYCSSRCCCCCLRDKLLRRNGVSSVGSQFRLI